MRRAELCAAPEAFPIARQNHESRTKKLDPNLIPPAQRVIGKMQSPSGAVQTPPSRLRTPNCPARGDSSGPFSTYSIQPWGELTAFPPSGQVSGPSHNQGQVGERHSLIMRVVVTGTQNMQINISMKMKHHWRGPTPHYTRASYSLEFLGMALMACRMPRSARTSSLPPNSESKVTVL